MSKGSDTPHHKAKLWHQVPAPWFKAWIGTHWNSIDWSLGPHSHIRYTMIQWVSSHPTSSLFWWPPLSSHHKQVHSILVPHSRTDYQKYSCFYWAPVIWNSLPPSVALSPNLATFKVRLAGVTLSPVAPLFYFLIYTARPIALWISNKKGGANLRCWPKKLFQFSKAKVVHDNGINAPTLLHIKAQLT